MAAPVFIRLVILLSAFPLAASAIRLEMCELPGLFGRCTIYYSLSPHQCVTLTGGLSGHVGSFVASDGCCAFFRAGACRGRPSFLSGARSDQTELDGWQRAVGSVRCMLGPCGGGPPPPPDF